MNNKYSIRPNETCFILAKQLRSPCSLNARGYSYGFKLSDKFSRQETLSKVKQLKHNKATESIRKTEKKKNSFQTLKRGSTTKV